MDGILNFKGNDDFSCYLRKHTKILGFKQVQGLF